MAVPIELDIDAILAANDRDIHKSPAMIDLPQHTANGDIKMVSTTLPASPLEGFVRIKDKVHLHTPAEPLPAGSRDPGFIIICSWAFAKPRYIVKYIKGYQSVYPNSKILLVQMAGKSSMTHSEPGESLRSPDIHGFVTSRSNPPCSISLIHL